MRARVVRLAWGLAIGALVTSGVPAAVQARSGAPPTYRVEVLGDFVPTAINESGQVAGFGGWPTTAFLYTDGVGLVALPALPGQQHRSAQDVNETGQVVGASGMEVVDPPEHAVRWTGGQAEDLGALEPGGTSSARGVNDLGEVVGSASVGSSTHAFLHTGGAGMVDITPGAGLAVAEDINNAGQVTGRVDGQAFRWTNGVLQRLGVPEGFAFSFGFGINDSGQVAGSTTSATGNSERIVRFTDGVGWEILGGAGETNIGFGINNDGTVVGQGRPAGGLLRAVIYFDGLGLLALEDLVTTTDWFLDVAYDINDAGQVVALGFSRITGESAALRLTPEQQPPPASGMHVGDVSVTLRVRSGNASGQAVVAILDGANAPVSGATVVGDWLLNGTAVRTGQSAVTVSDGTARFRSGRIRSVVSGDVVSFCVTGVTHPELTYDPASNVETCEQATVP